ncbi:META domain-containing protein [Ruficoccus sp. ZRK36]|uniref:META domain-containing protein n=1 Tax=Ruficoccus sp. ZRK36 TaxID=2866311 RepID=UPI001C7379B4|nr:META domain-containing protein [Ruficoccus sp. ZRK36]QYY34953.1 META domain-containing protein [Ruficoccus sp. ZRK36]
MTSLPLTLSALPASKSHSGRIVVKASRIEGDWVSTNLSGDAIWLVVKTVGVTFKKDGTFSATAQLHGGGTDTFSGPYHMDSGKIRLEPATEGTFICTYSIKQGTLTLYNAQHGITGTFQRGQLSTQSQPSEGSRGMPGMGF